MEHNYKSNITCPYCGWEDQDSWEFDQEEGTVECGGCEREFNVTRDIEVTCSTSKIACEDDKHSYKTDSHFVKKRKHLGKGEWEALPEEDWEYYRIEICAICDDKEFVLITKDEYERAMAV